MAKNQANSNQIKEKAVLGRHLAPGIIDGTHLKNEAIITGTHIAPASITDAHLDVDWGAKASAILQSKLVVDYVQAQPVTISAASGSAVVTSAISAPAAATSSDKGVVVDSAKNSIIVRKASDLTEPLRDTDGEEVKGHITHDGTDFKLSFFTVKAGVEIPYAFPEETEIAFQYPQRFDLETVSEMFGANEKFVDYGIDTSTRFDITQLVADIFGGTYTLTGDGIAANAQTLVTRVEVNELAIEALEADIVTVNDAISAVDAKASTNESAIATLEADVNVVETAVATLESAVTTHGTDIADLQAADGVLEGRIDTLEAVTIRRYDKRIEDVDLATSAVVFAIAAPTGKEPKTQDFDVYLNGMLQMAGVHYAEESAVDGKVASITFAPDALVAGDVVQVRWFA